MASLIFLLENTGELCLIILRREEGKSPSNPTDTTNTHFYAPTATRITFAPVTKLHKATTAELDTQLPRRRAVKNDSPRAPAIDHKWHSSPAMIKAQAKFGDAPSKTHPLRLFHILQAPSIMSELIPCLINPSTVLLLVFSHLAWKEFCRLRGQGLLGHKGDSTPDEVAHDVLGDQPSNTYCARPRDGNGYKPAGFCQSKPMPMNIKSSR